MASVTDSQRKAIARGLPSTASLLFTGLARLFAYDSDLRHWIYTGLSGVLCLLIDHSLKSLYLRLIELGSQSKVFETELYYDFSKTLVSINPWFLSFPLESGVLGFSFSDQNSAEDFQNNVRKHEKQKKSEFDPLKGAEFRSVPPQEPASRDYQRRMTMDLCVWDSRREQFNVDQVPAGLRRVFRKAGIRKNELKRRETAVTIFEGLVQSQVDSLLHVSELYETEAVHSRTVSQLSSQGIDPPIESTDSMPLLDQKILQLAHQRRQTLTETQTQLLHEIESGNVLAAGLAENREETEAQEEQRLAKLLAQKIEERRRALHLYDSSGDSSSESEWSSDSD